MYVDKDTNLKFLERLLLQEDTVLAEIIEQFGERLFRSSAREFPALRRDQIETVMNDLFLSVWDRPKQYDPEKSGLYPYLKMSLRADLINLVRERKKVLQTLSIDVGLFPENGNMGYDDIAEQIQNREQIAWIYRELRNIFPTDPDYTVASMMIEGIRSRKCYAEVLDILHLPEAEWKKQVDREKERIRKKRDRSCWKATLEKIKTT